MDMLFNLLWLGSKAAIEGSEREKEGVKMGKETEMTKALVTKAVIPLHLA
jgi:hypothetical protein